MSLWPCSWFRAKPMPALGVVAHALAYDEAVAIAGLRVRLDRITYYGDLTSIDAQIRRSLTNLLNPVVVCQPTVIGDLTTAVPPDDLVSAWGDAVTWQIGNEPKRLDELLQLTDVFNGARARWPRARIVPCGLEHGTPVPWIRQALTYGLGAAGMLCQHLYGTPLQDAVLPTLATLKAGGWTGRVWITECGSQYGPAQAPELAKTLELLRGKVERAYVYAWRSPDDSYTLTDETKQLLRSLA